MSKGRKKNKSRANKSNEASSTTSAPDKEAKQSTLSDYTLEVVPSTSTDTKIIIRKVPIKTYSNQISYTVPDNVLEKFVCHYCHRFLSMLPVKIYGSRNICGRCISKKGIYSSYNLIANLFLFKCINRLDGCTELLRCNKVLQHEMRCASVNNICPICLEQVSTYLLLKHFKTYHETSILTDNCFMVDIEYHAVTTEYVYIYKHLDFLIMINVTVNTNRGTYLCILPILLRQQIKRDRALHIKFTRYLEKGNVRESCFKMIDIEDSTEHHDHIFQITSGLFKKYSQAFVTFDFREVNICDKPPIRKKKEYVQQIWWRKILIDDIESHFREYFSMKSGTVFDVGEQKSIYVFCVNCKMVCQFEEEYRKCVYIHTNSSEYHMLCYFCLIQFRNNGVDIKTSLSCRIVPPDVYKRFKFECWWNCKQYLYSNTILNHELKCENAPKLKCSCKKDVALSDFNSHFRRFHLPCETYEYRNLITTNPFLYDTIDMKPTIVTIWLGETLVSVKLCCHDKYVDISVNYLVVRHTHVDRKLQILIFETASHTLEETFDSKGGKVYGLSSFLVKVYYQYNVDDT